MKSIKTVGRLYGIGDIHGCLQEITALLSHLETKEGLSQEDQVIFIGDYIDRGPNSRGVLDLLIQFKKRYPNTIFLRGNHEDMYMGFLGLGGMYGEWYLSNGGDKVFEEYNLSHHVRNSQDLGGFIVSGLTPKELLSLFPKEHVDFIASTEKGVVVDDTMFFVHAGVWPETTSPEDNTDEDLMWVRQPFLGSENKLGKTVIHGHTITKVPYFNLPYEIAIDTGCFFCKERGWERDGALTCIRVDKDNLINSTFLQVRSGTDVVLETTDGAVDLNGEKKVDRKKVFEH